MNKTELSPWLKTCETLECSLCPIKKMCYELTSDYQKINHTNNVAIDDMIKYYEKLSIHLLKNLEVVKYGKTSNN